MLEHFFKLETTGMIFTLKNAFKQFFQHFDKVENFENQKWHLMQKDSYEKKCS